MAVLASKQGGTAQRDLIMAKLANDLITMLKADKREIEQMDIEVRGALDELSKMI